MSTATTGSLDRYPLPRLLCFLHKKRFDGVLRLETDPLPRVIRLAEGVPVAVSGDNHEGLLKLFVDRGRIPKETAPALAEALSMPYTDPEAVLTSEAGLSAEEVQKGLRYALFQSLVGLFGERRAAFTITAGADGADGTGGTDGTDGTGASVAGAVEPLYLVNQGVATAYDEARFLEELAPLENQAIKARMGADDVASRCGFGEAEAQPMQYLQRGYWLLEDLLDALPDQRLTVLRVAYVLLAAEALDAAPADSVPRLRPKRQEEPGFSERPQGLRATHPAAPTDTALKRAESRAADTVQKPVPARGHASAPLSTPPPLPDPDAGPARPRRPTGISASATPPPTPGSGVHAASRATPPPTPGGGVSSVQRAAGAAGRPVTPTGEHAIRGRPSPTTSGLYARARVTPKSLTDARSAAAKTRPAIQDKPESLELLEEIMTRIEAMEGQSPFELLGVGLDAAVLDVKKAYVTLAKRLHPDRLVAMGLAGMREAADTLFKRLGEANQALSNDEQLAEAKRIYAGGAAGEDPEAALRAIEAEVNFQKGEVFFRKGDHAQAEAHFQASVEGNPEEGEHLAMLAWTRYQSIARELRGQHRDGIFKMMVQAVGLSPRCARAHYFLGMLHNEEKRTEQALTAFRTAASLKRGYIEAEREIRLIEMRKQQASKASANKGSFFDVFKRGKK